MNIFKKILLVSFSLFFVMGAFHEKADAKTIKFAVAADAHYSADGAGKTDVILDGFIQRLKENNYDFVVFLGDNINKSNKENLDSFLSLTRTINEPYYIVPGNRDVHRISGLAKKDYLEIVQKGNKYQRRKEMSYYFYPSKDVIAIVLDGATSGMPSLHGVYTQKTMKWLDDVLTKNKGKVAIIFQHFPIVEPDLDPSLKVIDKSDYRAVLRKHKNILAIFSGHYHKEAFSVDSRGINHVSAPALHQEPYYYQEVTMQYKTVPLKKKKLSDFKVEVNVKPAI